MCYKLTASEKKIVNKFKAENPHVCSYCGKEITDNSDLTVDHIHPVSKGGKTIKDNLTISCLECNKEKSNMTEAEYITYKENQKIINSFEVVTAINQLVALQSSILQRIDQVNKDFDQKVKQVDLLQREIMDTNFNACEGYFYAKQLKGLLSERTELGLLKDNYNQVRSILGNQRTQLKDANKKIQNRVAESPIIANNSNVINIKSVG
jgi:hypothetical protein